MVKGGEEVGWEKVFKVTKGNVDRHGRVRENELDEFVPYDNIKSGLCETHF